MYQRDIVALQHDPSERLPVLRLLMVLLGIVQHQIHVLIEADDVPLDPQVHVLEQPDLHARAVLQVAEYQVDGLDHHLLDFLRPLVRHFCAGTQKLDDKQLAIYLASVPRKRGTPKNMASLTVMPTHSGNLHYNANVTMLFDSNHFRSRKIHPDIRKFCIFDK